MCGGDGCHISLYRQPQRRRSADTSTFHWLPFGKDAYAAIELVYDGISYVVIIRWLQWFDGHSRLQFGHVLATGGHVPDVGHMVTW